MSAGSYTMNRSRMVLQAYSTCLSWNQDVGIFILHLHWIDTAV